MRKGNVEVGVVLGVVVILTLVAVLVAFAPDRGRVDEQVYFPNPTNYVVDDAGVISDTVEAELNEQLKRLDPVAQVSVVTVKNMSGLEVRDYGIQLASKFKVGYEGKDNGVILLIATEDRKVDIEVGTGVEDKITDAEAGRILDELVVPALKQGNWSGGVVLGVAGIVEQLMK